MTANPNASNYAAPAAGANPPAPSSSPDPNPYGNPFTVIDGDREFAVALYRSWLTLHPQAQPLRDDLPSLRGRNLACWCPLDQPCHADVLLELANQ